MTCRELEERIQRLELRVRKLETRLDALARRIMIHDQELTKLTFLWERIQDLCTYNCLDWWGVDDEEFKRCIERCNIDNMH